jgi:nitroreductase
VRKDGREYVDVDVSISFDHLVLAATAEGLGTCWIAAFDPNIVREVLGIPDGIEPLLLTPLGYPAVTAQPRERRALDEIVHWERWSAS